MYVGDDEAVEKATSWSWPVKVAVAATVLWWLLGPRP
jgi:hypothetical protein